MHTEGTFSTTAFQLITIVVALMLMSTYQLTVIHVGNIWNDLFSIWKYIPWLINHELQIDTKTFIQF